MYMRLSLLSEATIDEEFRYLYDRTLKLIPSKHKPALQAVIEWRPKLKSWGWSVNKSIQYVANAKKPLTFGFRKDVTEAAAKGLEFDDMHGIAYLPTNVEIAKLLNWALNSQDHLPTNIYHFILGLCAGYPIKDIVDFAMRYK